MGCVDGKTASRRDREQQPNHKEEAPLPHPLSHNNAVISEAQKKDLSYGPSVFPPPEIIKRASSSAEPQEVRSGQTNKENKQQSKKQLLKKYDIKVNNHAQRVLPVNSYRYDILLPHNPTLEEEQPLASPIVAPHRE